MGVDESVTDTLGEMYQVGPTRVPTGRRRFGRRFFGSAQMLMGPHMEGSEVPVEL